MLSKCYTLCLVLGLHLCHYVTGININHDSGSNSGTEFVLAFPHGIDTTSSLRLYLSTSVNESFSVHIETPLLSHTNINVTVSGGAETVVEIPSDLTVLGTSKSDKSIFVQAENFIALFASNMQPPASGDSFIVYPVEVLSTEYVSVNLKSKNDEYKSTSAIVAVKDHTIVHLSLPDKSIVKYNTTYTFGSQFSVNLKKYEIFQFSSEDDLSGTNIVSNYPIAVISGHQLGTPSVSSKGTRDMILEMLIPWTYWSTRYIAISNPVFYDGDGELIRIFTLCENATVIIDKSGVHSQINVSQESFYEFPLVLAEAAVITSDKPVLVSQVSSSYQYAAGSTSGDPRLMLPAPVNAWLNEYTFSTPGMPTSGSFNHGLVLVAYDKAIDTITLDNESLEPSLVWFEIAGTNLNYTVLPLSQGAHTLKCIGNLKCWGYVFGINVHEEYGTSIGRSFTKKRRTDANVLEKAIIELDLIDDQILLTTPVFSYMARSRTECSKMCFLYSCSFLSFRSTDGLCYLYTEDQTCSPKKVSSDFRLYHLRK